MNTHLATVSGRIICIHQKWRTIERMLIKITAIIMNRQIIIQNSSFLLTVMAAICAATWKDHWVDLEQSFLSFELSKDVHLRDVLPPIFSTVQLKTSFFCGYSIFSLWLIFWLHSDWYKEPRISLEHHSCRPWCPGGAPGNSTLLKDELQQN